MLYFSKIKIYLINCEEEVLNHINIKCFSTVSPLLLMLLRAYVSMKLKPLVCLYFAIYYLMYWRKKSITMPLTSSIFFFKKCLSFYKWIMKSHTFDSNLLFRSYCKHFLLVVAGINNDDNASPELGQLIIIITSLQLLLVLCETFFLIKVAHFIAFVQKFK